MILDRSEQFLVSSVGWMERGGFVVRDLATDRVTRFPGDEGAFVRLSAIDGDRFLAAVHASAKGSLRLTVRKFSAPATVLWSLHITPREQLAEGSSAAAAGIPRHHLATFRNGGRWDHHLVTVARDGSGAELSALPWYNADNYDLGYQALIDAVAVPSSTFVLVSIQCSSIVMIHDPQTGRAVGRLGLAGRRGNPMLTILGNELWTVDYDTFVRVDLANQEVGRMLLLQPAEQDTRLFAGDLFIWGTRRKAVVPRPFSGDVVVIDPDLGTLECAVPLGKQPLSCVVTENGRIIARDWQTGDWSEGKMPSTSFD